jgi:hypothetical protein
MSFTTSAPHPSPSQHSPNPRPPLQVREDVQDVLSRVGARWNLDDQVEFAGWARMGLPTSSVKITEVRKPNVGENKPAGVTAEVVLDTSKLRWVAGSGRTSQEGRCWAPACSRHRFSAADAAIAAPWCLPLQQPAPVWCTISL